MLEYGGFLPRFNELLKIRMSARLRFNTFALNIPLTPAEMGKLLLKEARKDDPDMEKTLGLVRSGADTNLADARGFSALMWAVTKGHDRLADAIIAAYEPESGEK